ncbi:hypothetical protein GUJ93_ZPchr0010g7728 [Zizania palustris]|uniref:Uncharacterized protein n=1 Tax=Zizania palustris TaxID=103762 RepID=A0A8J6BJS0_ZIZPA|nr:hypothetical protein GUJ93_ZPchr0010g7728 [Zizania palustris]
MVVKKQGGGYCGAGLAVRRSGRRLPSRRQIWRPAPLPPPPTSLPPPDLAAWPLGLSHWPPSPFLLPVLGRLGTAVNA